MMEARWGRFLEQATIEVSSLSKWLIRY